MITTNRLRLRSWRDSDLAPFAALNADPRVMEHMPKALTRAESDNLAARIRDRIATQGYGLWAVEVPTVPDFIGFVGLNQPRFTAHFTPCVEVGWRLAFAYWGQGYATEAASAVLSHAFGPLGLSELVAFTAPANWRSRRVMERLAMTRDPNDDFDHPDVPERSPLRRHVLYRTSSAQWANASQS